MKIKYIILIISLILLTISIIVFLVFGGEEKSVYENNLYNYSFVFPDEWSVEQGELLGKNQALFRDENEDLLLTVLNPYDKNFLEMHSLAQEEEYATNDQNTMLHYQLYQGMTEEFENLALVSWQKGCASLKDDCFIKGKDGGVLIMNLGLIEELTQERLDILSGIINSFKLTNVK